MSIPEAPRLSFAHGSNVDFIESIYKEFKNNPESVEPSWRYFFEGYEFVQTNVLTATSPGNASDAGEAKVEALINTYRRLGHLSAHLNPLAGKPEISQDMKPENHGLENIGSDRSFHPSNLPFESKKANFEEILSLLRDTYCRTIGADYRESNDIDAVLWIQEKMEHCRNKPSFSTEKKRRALQKLVEAEGFERFLQDRYLGQKRFSLEGLESMIVLLDVLASEASEEGVEEINIGMAHRGRLNVLANFMGKPYEDILKEFEGTEFYPLEIEGDVKYHKGYANEITTSNNKKLRLYLSPNPSHLEAVNPILEGFCRARQRVLVDSDRKKCLPVLIHGDAAFVGQGIVAETLNLAELQHYTTGGTIHIVANNQVGFTANPEETKSCAYSSDIAKLIRAPVLHVNADDTEAVMWCAILATSYRQKFSKDFVIDLVGYRRYGHNETDEPGFTQPLMYKTIKDHPTVLKLYSQQLNTENVTSQAESESMQKEFRRLLQEGMQTVRDGKYKSKDRTPESFIPSVKAKLGKVEDLEMPVTTQIREENLRLYVDKITRFPEGFTPHPKIAKLYESRREMLQNGGSIDWGLAELLAFASCADEGHHVRLSGQDCGRGTFSHRQAVLRDFQTNTRLEMLNQVSAKQAPVQIVNSPLSENGCMGFEFGYSVADPNSLIIWEAQFGDFANGAQIIIDQFLVASEAKWKQTSGLVLLLPHGYEGQGPEHSSARLERYLQSCGSENIQVANVTTPAQFFHMLRRQVMRDFRKPLIVMTPKSLLRHPQVISPITSFTSEHFTEIIDDASITDPKSVRRIVVCTGKIYYDLLAARSQAMTDEQVPLVRIEQIYPFANKTFSSIMDRYSNAKEIIWTQEEPINMGAWTFMRHRLEEYANAKKSVTYVGRKGSGSTAEGSLKSHLVEQQRIVHGALGLQWDKEKKLANAGKT